LCGTLQKEPDDAMRTIWRVLLIVLLLALVVALLIGIMEMLSD